VTWSSKKQAIVALSSTEAEYVAKELIGSAQFFGELTSPFENPTTLDCDNQGAIRAREGQQIPARGPNISIFAIISFARPSRTAKSTCNYIPTNDNLRIFSPNLSLRRNSSNSRQCSDWVTLEGECRIFSYITRGLVIILLFYAIYGNELSPVVHYLLPFAYIARLIFFPKLRREHSPLCLVIQCTDILCSLTV